MFKNFISVSALCTDNIINVLFFDSFFQVQDHHTWVPLVHEQHRDGVYYWPKSVLFPSSALALSSLVWSSLFVISMWHNHLGHPSLPIFRKFLSVLSIYFLKEHSCAFSCNSCNINKSHKLHFTTPSITSSFPLESSFLMFEPPPLPLLIVFTTTLFLLTITQSIFGFTRYVVNQMFIQPLSHSRTLFKTISPPPLEPFTQIIGTNF